LFTAKDSETTKEMEMSANFQGSFYREETTSAGWGQLERSFKSEQEDMLDDDADLVPVRLKYGVKGQHVTPPPLSINYAGASQSSSDQYDSPIKLTARPPLQSLASVGSVAPPELFSPNSIMSSPEKTPWPNVVGLTGFSPLPVMGSVDQIEGDYRFKPGRGFLQFCKDHMAARDLLYCLLHGRPLVVIGDPSQENLIRRLVRVLWLFVPGHSSSHQVIPWQEKPLTPVDVSRVKLMGLCQNKSSKHPALLPHIKRYVSYWDCTNARVCTPTYEGELLKPILSRTKDRKNEPTFLAHIHSVLADIAMQAYVYYHGYCINSARNKRRLSPEAAPVRHHKVKEETVKTRKQFLHQIGLKSNDVDIVEYLVSVIQNQQLEEHSIASSPNAPVTVKLRTKLCQESICKPKKPY
jgi:hypothetical protein